MVCATEREAAETVPTKKTTRRALCHICAGDGRAKSAHEWGAGDELRTTLVRYFGRAKCSGNRDRLRKLQHTFYSALRDRSVFQKTTRLLSFLPNSAVQHAYREAG